MSYLVWSATFRTLSSSEGQTDCPLAATACIADSPTVAISRAGYKFFFVRNAAAVRSARGGCVVVSGSALPRQLWPSPVSGRTTRHHFPFHFSGKVVSAVRRDLLNAKLIREEDQHATWGEDEGERARECYAATSSCHARVTFLSPPRKLVT